MRISVTRWDWTALVDMGGIGVRSEVVIQERHTYALTPDGFTVLNRINRLEALLASLRAEYRVDGQLARPHILWFDEYYEERLHRSTTALKHAAQSGLFVTVGSSGSTNLPLQAAAEAARNGAVMIDINPNDNAFSRFVQSYERGLWLQGSASLWLPKLAELLGAQPAPGAD